MLAAFGSSSGRVDPVLWLDNFPTDVIRLVAGDLSETVS